MPPTDPAFSLSDLARAAGVTPRTVRYYLAQGLLPPPIGAGRGPHYDGDHLARLRLVRNLQERHLPLAEIRRQLASMSAAEVLEASELAPKEAATQADQPGSALQYVRSVLGATGGSAIGSTAPRMAAAIPAPRLPAPPRPEARPAGPEAGPAGPFGRLLETMPGRGSHDPAATSGPMAALSMPRPRAEWPDEPSFEEAAVARASGPVLTEPPPAERSQWDRIALGPDVELHVRRPLSRLDNKRVERLIATARHILKGGS
jgi:DNA-binding transcriptional MerR regulator